MKYQFKSDKELIEFINENIITTMEVAELLNCSRQNIDDLVRRGKLVPVRKTQRDKWFLKADILARIK
jgi:excisionase family DNA binding protein